MMQCLHRHPEVLAYLTEWLEVFFDFRGWDQSRTG